MSSLQQYLQNALTVDEQESGEEMNYKATKEQLKAMGEGIREQALGSLPFSIAEVSRGVSGLYRTLQAGQNLIQRKGGIGDLLAGIGKGSDEPFDIGKLANKLAGVGGDKLVELYGDQAKKYGINLKAIHESSKSGGVDSAIAETKTQLKTIADKNIERATGEINRGVGQFTGAVAGKAQELQQAVREYSGKGLDELKSIHTQLSETLKSYSPADIANLSESGKVQFNQINDLVSRGEVTPEGLATLKTSTQSFAKQALLEKEVGRLTKVKELFSEKATRVREAVVERTEKLTHEHQIRLGTTEEQLSKLQSQKEASENIIKQARGRLKQQAEDIFKAQPTMEDAGTVSRYRSGGSVNVSNQVKRSQSAVDEELIARHMNITEGLESQIGKIQAGKEQLISEFSKTIEKETAPFRQQLAEIAPRIESATVVAQSYAEQASRLGSQALDALGHAAAVAGLATGIEQLTSGQTQTGEEKANVGVNIAAGGKQAADIITSHIGKLTATEGPKEGAEAAAKEGGLSAEETAAKEAADAAAKKAVAAVTEKGAETFGVELGAEAAVEAGASVIPVVGEAIDIGLGLAMGIQSLVDIFGGHHEQAPPPPPSEVVQFQHSQGVY